MAERSSLHITSALEQWQQSKGSVLRTETDFDGFPSQIEDVGFKTESGETPRCVWCRTFLHVSESRISVIHGAKGVWQ